MDFIDNIKELSKKVSEMRGILQTEEATKTALIMPFINILGYDIFNPTEVIPEFTADVGIKKGEKVDYAIKKDGKVIIIFECKHCGETLDNAHASQLFRYFSTTETRVAVLTNGIVYQFFTDLENKNKMDEKPFLEIDLLELHDSSIKELKKLSKPTFDIDELMTSAGELKYTNQIKKLLSEQLDSPSDDFVKFVAGEIFNGILTPTRREYFAGLTKRGFNSMINEKINRRLKSAMSGSEDQQLIDTGLDTTPKENLNENDPVETTEEELEGFFIVKALLRGKVDTKRIVHRDTQSYFGILLDDNNRKPLARLRFNTSQKYLGVFDENRKETKIPISNLDEIYEHSTELNRVFDFYENEDTTQEQSARTEND